MVHRTHDTFYKNEKNNEVKQSFIEIADIIHSVGGAGLKIADIGCAAGVMPGYLHKRFPQHEILGLEYRKDLVSEARRRYPEIVFEEFDVQDKSSAPRSAFDIITMCGVMQIFDDWTQTISNLLHWRKNGGLIIVHGLFNDFDIDVNIHYREAEGSLDARLEAGWNIVSKKSIGTFLSQFEDVEFDFVDFQMKQELEKRPNDPVRSWTEKDIQGRLQIFNGLCIRQPHSFLIISHKH